MKWAVYYSDNTVISSNDFTPFEIPRRVDVQVVVQESKDHRWVTKSGFDFYCWDDRGGGWKWFGADYSGLMQYLQHPGEKCVLHGYEIDKDCFREIFDRARSEWGNKEIFERGERHP